MSTSTLLPCPKIELANAVLIALAKQCDKWGDRDQLEDGGKYVVKANVAGVVNGHSFSLPVDTVLTVGHATNKASSQVPELSSLLAIMLDFIPADVRNDVIEYMLDEYNVEHKLVANEAQLAQVDELLSQMRQAKTVPTRGSVNVRPSVKECLPMVAVA